MCEHFEQSVQVLHIFTGKKSCERFLYSFYRSPYYMKTVSKEMVCVCVLFIFIFFIFYFIYDDLGKSQRQVYFQFKSITSLLFVLHTAHTSI